MKKTIAIAWMVLIVLPCFLTFSETNDGCISVLNFVGIAWALFLIKGGFTKLTKKWMRRYFSHIITLE